MGTLHYLEWEYWNQTWWSPHTVCSCITISSQVQELLHSKGEIEMEDEEVLSGIQCMDWISPLHTCSYVTHEDVASSLPDTLLSRAPTLHCLPTWTPSMKPPYHHITSPSGVLFSLYGMNTWQTDGSSFHSPNYLPQWKLKTNQPRNRVVYFSNTPKPLITSESPLWKSKHTQISTLS